MKEKTKKTTKENKVKLAIIALVLVIAIIIVVVAVKNKKTDEENKPNIAVGENGEVNNISKKVYEAKNVESVYEMTCTSLKYDGKNTKANIKIKNISGTETKGRLTKIVFLDSKGAELSNMSLYVRAIGANQEFSTTASISANIVDAYDYKIIFVN